MLPGIPLQTQTAFDGRDLPDVIIDMADDENLQEIHHTANSDRCGDHPVEIFRRDFRYPILKEFSGSPGIIVQRLQISPETLPWCPHLPIRIVRILRKQW